MKLFACKDLGMDCDWKCRATTDEEIIRQAEEHGRKEHGIQKLDEQLRNKIQAKIREVRVA